jgi:hypothetical protein
VICAVQSNSKARLINLVGFQLEYLDALYKGEAALQYGQDDCAFSSSNLERDSKDLQSAE